MKILCLNQIMIVHLLNLITVFKGYSFVHNVHSICLGRVLVKSVDSGWTLEDRINNVHVLVIINVDRLWLSHPTDTRLWVSTV